MQLANITVFYVMAKKMYNVPNMMLNAADIKRFIDDGMGFFFGTEEEFIRWLEKVNQEIRPYGLYIDESSFKENGCFINSLDIKYCFDEEGMLQTDLYRKETDSLSYLNFSSAHPNHMLSGTVYSQCLRLRRIINSRERLEIRLTELAEAFKKAGYPEKMVKNIQQKSLTWKETFLSKKKERNSKTKK